MGRLAVFNILLCIMLALGGCKSGEPAETASTAAGKQAESSMGILPTRIENIDKGGTIPAGCEGKDITESDYRLEMLWGTWVPEGSGDTGKIPDTDKTITLGEGEDAVEIMCWPREMTFAPAWAGVETSGTGMIDIAGFGGEDLSEEGSIRGKALAIYNQNLERIRNVYGGGFKSLYGTPTPSVNDPMGVAFETNGYGFGSIDFEPVEINSDDYANPADYTVALHSATLFWDCNRKIVYDINGNVLSIGITDAKEDEDVMETSIKEVDYSMSWTGSKLELTYDGETVVYVPEQIEKESKIYIRNAGPVLDSDVADGIYGITISADTWDGSHNLKEAVMYDAHEGYVEASYQFGDDGTLIFDSADGDKCTYTYLYAGDSLTLISDGKPHVYSLFTYRLQSPLNKAIGTLYIKDDELRSPAGNLLAWFIEKGFTSDYDLAQPMASCQVTDVIPLDYNGVSIDVKVVNPYEKPIPLGKCFVCYIYVDDASGVIVNGDNTKINQTTYDEVSFLYDVPYEKKDNMLRYKGEYSFCSEPISYDNPNRSLLDLSGDTEVIYDFQDGILKNYRLEVPALLYNGLQDNVDASILANMAPSKFSGIIEVRDTILDRLKSAFQSAGVSVGIDDSTGEIVLDSNILFGVDKTDLSDEGKQYIDSFMGVYASVITDNEFADYIDKVLFEGHTDSSGSYNYNMELSQARADAVLEYCLNSGGSGMSPEQREVLKQLSSTIGYSCSNLIYDEDGKEDMDASRRVAIKFYIKVDS